MGKLKGMDSPPGRSAPHLVADFVELMCAATVDGEWSISDLRALRKAKDKDHATVRDPSDRELLLGEDDPQEASVNVAVAAALDLPVAETDPDDSESDDDGGDDDHHTTGDVGANADAGPAEDDDARSAEGSEIADVLSYRSKRFADAWPFELFDEDNLRLRDPLEARHRTYLLLLIASCLSRLSKDDGYAITMAFERLAPKILSGHLGPRAEAHLFGTSGDEHGQYPDSKSLWEKFEQLAKDLRVKLLADREEVEANYSGDNGLDAVAWLPTGDQAPSLVSVFAQCACGSKWRSKQHEGSEQRWGHVMAFRSPLVNMTLIPYSFRRPDGTWDKELHVERGVLLDRERILHALEAGGADHAALVPALVDELVAHGAS